MSASRKDIRRESLVREGAGPDAAGAGASLPGEAGARAGDMKRREYFSAVRERIVEIGRCKSTNWWDWIVRLWIRAALAWSWGGMKFYEIHVANLFRGEGPGR